jgi:hypothetical protein
VADDVGARLVPRGRTRRRPGGIDERNAARPRRQ